jgi:hypothetical protein
MNDELLNPVAKIDEALAEYPETLRFRAVAWVLGRDVSPRITPAEVLTQLGDGCPGELDVIVGELTESTGHRGGGDGTTWKDNRPCTPRGDRKAVFGGDVEAAISTEAPLKDVS